MFFTNKDRFFKYIKCILIGLPTWYVIGILVTFSDQFGKNMGIAEPIDPGRAIMFAYVGISLGDIAIGFVSQALKSRRKALFIFYIMTMICIALFFLQRDSSASVMYLICAALGFSTGFWAIFVTMAAEQFGTNLRATAATTVPNMVRGALPLMILLFKSLREGAGFITGGIITGIIIMVITLVAAYFTKETFGKDLRYVE
jgi:sugar phosphate permease